MSVIPLPCLLLRFRRDCETGHVLRPPTTFYHPLPHLQAGRIPKKEKVPTEADRRRAEDAERRAAARQEWLERRAEEKAAVRTYTAVGVESSW
jgi:hypothetical protein